MASWTLEQVEDQTVVLTMDSGENRITSASIDLWNQHLDAVEQMQPPHALVVTGTGNYWSTGLDLDVVNGLSFSEQETFMVAFDRLLGRLLTSPFVTVAGLNGHTYAGGALLALACDYRVMRRERGFFALPSVDVGIAFTPGMSALISAKIPQPAAHDLVVSCKNITAREAEAMGIINRVEDGERVLPVSVELATAVAAKDPITLATVKRRMYAGATSLLLADG